MRYANQLTFQTRNIFISNKSIANYRVAIVSPQRDNYIANEQAPACVLKQQLLASFAFIPFGEIRRTGKHLCNTVEFPIGYLLSVCI